MKVLVQRVSRAGVRVDGRTVGEIGPGLLVFVGVEQGDLDAHADWYADRVAGLRIFADDSRPMNRSVQEVGGAVLVVSQFTLAGSTRKGRRPSFDGAAAPDVAERLYLRFVEAVRAHGLRVKTGVFQAMMEVELVNNGPVTFLLDGPGGGRGEVP